MRRALAALAVGLGVVMAAMIGFDWWRFVVRRDVRAARASHFGWEGAWSHPHPTVYGWSCLESAVVILAIAVTIAAGLVRRSWRWLALAALLWGAELARGAVRDGRLG